MARSTISHVGVVGVGIVLAAALGGCGRGPGNTAQPAPISTSIAPSSTSTPSGTPSQAAGSTPGAPPAQPDGFCKAADVTLTLGRGDAGAGTVYRPLIITDVSGRRCVVQGFPGVSYVAGADGHQVGPVAARVGTVGTPITLNKGESATVDIGFVNVANYDPGVCQPTPVNGLRVYLPQDTAARFVESPGTGCASDTIPGDQLTVKTAVK
jgi:hypothetical protein